MIYRNTIYLNLLILLLMAIGAGAQAQAYYGDNRDVYTINQDGNNTTSGLRINRANSGWFLENYNTALSFRYSTSNNPTDHGLPKITFENDGDIFTYGGIVSYKDIIGYGNMVLPNNTGERSIYTWSPSDRNWRIGMNTNPGFSRSLVTSHTQFVTYSGGSTQGFAVGRNGGASSFEVRGSDHQAYFRGKVGIGTSSLNGYALNVNGTINATELRVNGVAINGAGSSIWSKSGNNISYNTGNVGVGTTGSWRTLNLPASGQITFGNSVSPNTQAGLYWHGGSDYGIYRTSGAWSAPNYQQLKLKWHTGIVLDPGAGMFGKSHVGVNGGVSIGTGYHGTEYHNGLIVEGNVGIGTPSPTERLDVDGHMNLDGDLILPNYLGDDARAIYTWKSKDKNWRIGMHHEMGINRELVTSFAQYLTYGTGGGQGFVLGVNNGNSSFEVRGSDHQAYFRGNVGIGIAPAYKFHVKSGNSELYFRNYGNATQKLEMVSWDNGININNTQANKHLYLNRDASSGSNLYLGQAGREVAISGLTGNVGIGTTSPSEKLDVNGTIKATGMKVNGNAELQSMKLGSTNIDVVDASILTGPIVVANSPGLSMLPATELTLPGVDLANNTMWVEDGVISESFTVMHPCLWNGNDTGCPTEDWDNASTNDNWWGDYVFDTAYELRPLEEVKAFVLKNHHLPEVPSIRELRNGYGLHDMNKNFIVKIEELTLYTIKQQEVIDAQEAKLEEQVYRNDRMQQLLESLALELEQLKNKINEK